MINSHAPQVFVHRIDAADFIRFVSESWVAFGTENRAGQLARTVVGTQLWRYIAGVEVRRIYRALLERIRADRRPIQFPFRCDSPTVRRYMRMMVMAQPDGSVEFQSELVREERRAALSVLDPASPRGNKRIMLCAWCKRVERDGQWYELDDAVHTLSFFDPPRPPHLDHDVCPHCRDIVK